MKGGICGPYAGSVSSVFLAQTIDTVYIYRFPGPPLVISLLSIVADKKQLVAAPIKGKWKFL